MTRIDAEIHTHEKESLCDSGKEQDLAVLRFENIRKLQS